MDVGNLAPLDDKKSEMKGICVRGGAVKEICLKGCNKCGWNGTSPHYVPGSVGVLVSDLEKNRDIGLGYSN